MVLDHLVLIKMRVDDGALHTLEHVRERSSLCLAKVEHGDGAEDLHPVSVLQLLILHDELIEEVLLDKQMDGVDFCGTIREEVGVVRQGDEEVVHLHLQQMVADTIFMPSVDHQHYGIEAGLTTGLFQALEDIGIG